jgi:hypothetical protein
MDIETGKKHLFPEVILLMDEVEVEEIIQGENNHLVSVIEPRPEPMDHLDIILFSSPRRREGEVAKSYPKEREKERERKKERRRFKDWRSP